MTRIDRLFWDKLTQLMLLAEGPSIAFDREAVKGGDRETMPKSYGNRYYEFLSRYRGARSDTTRLRIIAEIQDELRMSTVKPVRNLYPETLEWMVAIHRDRRNEHTVAYAYGCNVNTVRKVKRDLRERVKAALEKGESVRKVALVFGLSPSSVARMR